MKLVFFGTPNFAVPSLNALHESSYDVLGVVTAPDKKLGRGLKIQSSAIKIRAKQIGLRIFQPIELNCAKFISTINQMNPDIYVVVAYKILPEAVLKIPDRGAINLHASLLPKYRGAAPVNHALLNGELQTGLTTFMIQNKVDTGDILLQKSLDIDVLTTAGEALEKLSFIGAELVIQTLNQLLNNTITAKKQDNASATFAPKIRVSDCKIHWDDTARNIHNQIRAFSPNPGAFTFYKGKRIKLFGSSIAKTEIKIKLEPGYINYKEPILEIGTGSSPIKISNIQLEGKKRLPVSQFILGYPEITGNKFD